MDLSDVSAADLPEVLELNESSLPHVSSVSLQEMRWFRNHAHYFRVVRRDNRLAGFLIGLRPGLAYGSRGTPNVPGNTTLVFEVQLVDVR